MSVHDPMHPGWLCRGCGRPWPCWTRCQELVAEFTREPESLVLLMTAELIVASRELADVPAGVLRARFLGWAPGSAESSVTAVTAARFLSAMQELGDLPAGALYARFLRHPLAAVYGSAPVGAR